MKPKTIKSMPPSQRRNKKMMQNRYETLIKKYGKKAGVMKFMKEAGISQEEE